MSIPSKSWLLSPNDKPYAEDLYNQDSKTSLTDNDAFPLTDSAAGNVQKKTLWSTVKNALKTYFDTVYAALSHTHTKSQISDFPTSMTPTAHKSSHAAGQGDALSPADIGAAASSHTHTKSQITDFPTSFGTGDMLQSTYDTDANGVVNDSDKLGGVAASGYAKEINGQTAFTDIDDADYVPMYDTSATAQKKSLWSNVKSVLKTYFDTLYAPKLASGSSTTNSTTGRAITHTFGSIAATAYRVIITPTLTAAPTTSTAGSLGEVYVVKAADGTFTIYNTGVTGVAFDWLATKA